jgi:hypothetical protein
MVPFYAGAHTFKAYGFSPTRFVLFALDEHNSNNIELLRRSGGLDRSHCFVYSNGVITNHTSEFRKGTRSFYSLSPEIMQLSPKFIPRDPPPRIDVSSSELVAGRDTLTFRVVNLNAQSIDLLYELNGELQPPTWNWRLNGDSVSVPVDKSTPRGEYHWIGMRDASSPLYNQWIPIDVRISVR